MVTGGASGVGRAVSAALQGLGAKVAVLDIVDARGAEAVGQTGATYVRCDVADRDSWTEAAAHVAARLGPPTFVHLNAGIMSAPPDGALAKSAFRAVMPAQYRRIVGVNVDGVVFGVQAVLPHMEANGGAIVVTGSLAGVVATPFDPLYAMTKHALVGFVRSVAPELAALNVTINALCPGGIDTPLVPKDIRAFKPTLMTADDVAAEVLNLFRAKAGGEIWGKLPGKPAFRIDAPAISMM
jgi:NAD(P)-dependent dehydrogenase (short-subunit alcohol dehydrogenase family)